MFLFNFKYNQKLRFSLRSSVSDRRGMGDVFLLLIAIVIVTSFSSDSLAGVEGILILLAAVISILFLNSADDLERLERLEEKSTENKYCERPGN